MQLVCFDPQVNVSIVAILVEHFDVVYLDLAKYKKKQTKETTEEKDAQV